MLIKAVNRQGNAVPYTPEEALPFAVEYGVKSNNTLDTVYWVIRESIKIKNVHFNQKQDGAWEAIADGTADIGFTESKTDRFHDPKPHRFSVQYTPTKDSLGMPDIAVVKFEIEKIGQNPSASVGV